jgi:hypothetical protein
MELKKQQRQTLAAFLADKVTLGYFYYLGLIVKGISRQFCASRL